MKGSWLKEKDMTREEPRPRARKAFRHLPLEELWKLNQKEMGVTKELIRLLHRKQQTWDSKPIQRTKIRARDNGVLDPEVTYSQQVAGPGSVWPVEWMVCW